MKKGFFLIFSMLSAGVFAQEITNVSFVQEGEVSKLVIESDKDIFGERFPVSEDKQIILDIKNVKVSPKLLRGIDTSEFPGSTVYVSGYKKPGSENDVRFAIQLRDNVRSILDIKPKKLILNIENRFGVFSQSKIRNSEGSNPKEGDVVVDKTSINVPKSNSVEDILENLTMSGPKKYIGKRITINVKDASVPDLLNMIADTSGFNIIIDQELSKLSPLTLTLTNIPWDQALDTIMGLSKIVAEKSANILVVKTFEKAAKENEEQLKAAQAKVGLEPLVTRVFLINHATLGDIQKIVKDYSTPTRGIIQTDERTNSLIVKDTVDAIERIKKIIETLDTQTPQILIEAKIVEANESYSKVLGLTKGVSFGYDPITTSYGTPTGPGFSFSSIGDPSAMGFTVGVFKRLSNLTFSLQMLEAESKGRVISSPKVVTQNKKAATLTSKEQTSFPMVLQNGTLTTQTFEKISAGVTLAVTPQVTNDGSINLIVNVTKDSFGSAPPSGPPNMNTRSITTNVLVANGSTVVIGGLYSTSSLESHQGIPLLKDLPLIGWLFRTPYNPKTTKNELVIFITPRIINQEEAGLSGSNSGQTEMGGPEI